MKAITQHLTDTEIFVAASAK